MLTQRSVIMYKHSCRCSTVEYSGSFLYSPLYIWHALAPWNSCLPIMKDYYFDNSPPVLFCKYTRMWWRWSWRCRSTHYSFISPCYRLYRWLWWILNPVQLSDVSECVCVMYHVGMCFYAQIEIKSISPPGVEDKIVCAFLFPFTACIGICIFFH